MKLTLVASTLLVAISLGSMTADDVTGLKRSEVGKKLVSVLKQDNMEDLLAAFLEQYIEMGDETIKKHLGKVSASHVRSMGLHQHRFSEEEMNLVWFTALLPEAALREVGKDQLRKVLILLTDPMENYVNFPAEFFRDEKFAVAVFANFTCFEENVINDFLCTLNIEQFNELVRNVPDFHDGQLNCEALNTLAQAVSGREFKQWMCKVTPRFLYTLGRKRKLDLHSKVVENLPDNFMNGIKPAINAKRTSPPDAEQLNVLTPFQWNEPLSRKEALFLILAFWLAILCA